MKENVGNVSEKQENIRLNQTDTPRQINVDSTSILHRYVKDQISTNFHVIFTYFFDVISLIKKSTSFSRTFINIILLVEKSTLFPRTFFDVISMVQKSTLFPRTFFCVISLIKIYTVFVLTFFNIILMVKKSTLFARTFFSEILMGKNATSFLVSCKLMKTFDEVFLLLETLKS